MEEDSHKTQNDIMADMTRQYKSTFAELTETETNLQQRGRENAKEIEKLEKDYETLDTEFKNKEKMMKEELDQLAKHLGEMSTEFSSMLKETLEKMKLRIEAANS